MKTVKVPATCTVNSVLKGTWALGNLSLVEQYYSPFNTCFKYLKYGKWNLPVKRGGDRSLWVPLYAGFTVA